MKRKEHYSGVEELDHIDITNIEFNKKIGQKIIDYIYEDKNYRASKTMLDSGGYIDGKITKFHHIYVSHKKYSYFGHSKELLKKMLKKKELLEITDCGIAVHSSIIKKLNLQTTVDKLRKKNNDWWEKNKKNTNSVNTTDDEIIL